jgi:S-ribosylhomocysteine lyase
VTTFDIRMTEPNRQEPISGAALHTIEHLAATYLRNRSDWQSRVVYWGPMGCRTGNYLLLAGDYTSADILPLVRDTFEFIANFQGDIPGATPHDCGNYSYMDLPEARRQAQRYLDEVLTSPSPDNLTYPA